MPQDVSPPNQTFSSNTILQNNLTVHHKLLKYKWPQCLCLKEMGIPDHLTCLLKTCVQVKKQQLELDMKQQTGPKLGKEYVKSVLFSPCLFNLYAEYILQNTGLDEAQARIKIHSRNINNLRYANDTTVIADMEEELKSFLMRVKEKSEKAGLKLNIQKTKTMASGPMT